MKILVGQYHLNSVGGTETFTYTLVKELHKQGHIVDLLTFIPGYVSDFITQEIPNIQVNVMKTDKHDVSLVNHNVVVDKIKGVLKCEKIIQTCHGVIPPLEKPSINADHLVSISKEIYDDIKKQGFNGSIILNGIDCDRFDIKVPLNTKIKRILSLAQSESANKLLQKTCDILGCELITLNKNTNPKFDIENDINNVDLVVGLGRSAYDAIACGRPVFIWDDRNYQGNLGDGYLTIDNFNELIKTNCSGRRYKKPYTAEQIALEIQEHYNHNDSQLYRDLALTEFNITKQVKKYLEI
jgi:hypothetical protein